MIKFKSHLYVFFVHIIVAIVLQSTTFAMTVMDKKYVVMTLELYYHWFLIRQPYFLFNFLFILVNRASDLVTCSEGTRLCRYNLLTQSHNV